MREGAKLHVVCVSSNNDRHPVPKTFTPLHYTSLHLSTLHVFPFKLYTSTSYALGEVRAELLNNVEVRFNFAG